MRNGEMGNEEMRKWEESTLNFTQQTADILLLHSSNVMRKFYVHPAFIEGIIYTLQFAPKGYVYDGIEYCIMVGKLVLQFWQLVRFL